MSELAKLLLDTLTFKPQTRAELCDKLHCGERAVRRAVEELREYGYNIASNSETGGYWLGSEADRERTINELRSRARKLEQTAAALEKGVDIGQMEVAL